MATKHSNLLSILLLFVATFFYLHPAATAIREVTPTGAPAPAPFAALNSGDTNAVAFIRSTCGGTHFSEACFSSLSRYADAINEDPAELTRIALSLSATKARGLASLMTTGGADPSDASTFLDCSTILGEIIDNIHSSVKMIRRTNSGGDRAELLSKTQTLMRATLANVDSCSTELEGAKDGAKFENQVMELKELISNGLDIVNSYARKIS